jgi:hypothetical protein
LVPVEALFYQSVGAGELQLSYALENQDRQVVPPAAWVPAAQPFVATTDASGAFTLMSVPSTLTGVRVRATVRQNNQQVSGLSGVLSPLAADSLTAVEIVVAIPR